MFCISAVSPVTLDLRGIHARHGMGRTAVYRAIHEHGFPRPLKVGRRSYWPAAEVDAWFVARAAERDQAAAPSDAIREARRRAGLASAAARRARRAATA